MTKFDKEARDNELIFILISSILLQKKSKKSFALKGAQLTDCVKFSHSVKEKSRIVLLFVY